MKKSINKTTKKMIFKKHWYLGFLGIVGFYEMSDVFSYFNGEGSIWAFANLLWFLWFAHFIPKFSTLPSEKERDY